MSETIKLPYLEAANGGVIGNSCPDFPADNFSESQTVKNDLLEHLYFPEESFNNFKVL